MLQIRISLDGKFLEPSELFVDKYTIGRNGSIRIPQLWLNESDWRIISRMHCTLIAVHPTYLVVDGNNQGKHSDNGIMVNGKKCRAAMLKAGDVVALSTKVFFELLSDEPIEFGSPDDTSGAEKFY